MHSRKIKKIVSVVVSMAIVLSAMIVSTVSASAATAQVKFNIDGNTGYTANFKGSDSNHSHSGEVSMLSIGGKTAYCLESGKELLPNNTLSDDAKWNNLSKKEKSALGIIFYYGYPNNSGKVLSGDKFSRYMATQAIVWEIMSGYRSTSTYKRTDARIYNGITPKNSAFVANYNAISDAMINHETIPSFMGDNPRLAKTVNLKYNSGTKKYEATLTDTNKVLSKFSFSASGCTFTKSGNKLKVSSSTPNKTVTVTARFTVTNNRGNMTVWGASGKQTVATGYAQVDPVNAYINVKTPDVGNLVVDKTIKSSVSGGANGVKTSNFSFNLSGTAKDGTKVNLNAATNANGRATFSNVPVGTYTLKENATNPSNGTNKAETFIMPKPRKVTITKGKTTNLTGKNAMPNEMVEVRVVKRFTDKSGKLLKDVPLKGYTFKLTGTTLYGEKVERTGTSDANGKLTFTNLWKGKYTITEVNSGKAQYCTLPKAKTVTWVAADNSKYKSVSLDNTPKYGSVDLQKLIKTADGADVSGQDLSGFEFNLSGTSDIGIKVNVIKTTDKDGKASFADVPVGNYTLKEIVNAKSMQFKIGLPLTIRVNYNQTTKVTRNNYIPTDVTIFKVDADTHKVITDGVTKLKVCKVTDSGFEDIGVYTTIDGAVEIKDVVLENGKYAIIELEAPDGYVLSTEPTYFEIADGVDENGRNKKAPTVFVDNSPIEVVLEKKSVDGTSIPNTLLAVYDSEGKLVTESYTDENGQLVIKNLTAGAYTWKEVEAPDGYAINENVYTFVINKDGTLTDESVTQMTDEPTKVKVYKVDDTDLPLAGAEFTMYDTEGNVVDTKVTDQDGLAEFIQFVQGKYIIRETKAPKGYLLEDTEFEVYNDGHWVNNSPDAEITAPNHKLPEIHTTATIDGAKTAHPAETLTINDVVSCKNLIVGKEYTVPGVIMDKATGEPFTVDGEKITSKVTFIAEESNCDITVSFTFDASGITTETNLVVFESLYSDGIELATHADINDEGQTVKIEIPEEIEPEPVPEEVKPEPEPEEVKPAPEPEEIVPKTGDDFVLPAVLLAISSLALVTALIASHRRKKNEQ